MESSNTEKKVKRCDLAQYVGIEVGCCASGEKSILKIEIEPIV